MPPVGAAPELSPSQFVAILNQGLDMMLPEVTVVGELSNLRISRGRWVYFDLKDDAASVKCFGAVNVLPGPLEDGLLVRITANPRLHALYGFSLNLRSVVAAGEGSIKKAQQLLAAKLESEGLFAPERKRPLPYPPRRIGLITSVKSAAYADFIKILGTRFGGLTIEVIDSQVQGEAAPAQLVAAVQRFNAAPALPDILVMIRGGGSSDDLAAFSTEPVVRAIAGSRIPTLVAIGHEVDLSLAELAADRRASTPSNAAELLVPDKVHELAALAAGRRQLASGLGAVLRAGQASLAGQRQLLADALQQKLSLAKLTLKVQSEKLAAYDPALALQRGYAIIRAEQGSLITEIGALKIGQNLKLELKGGQAGAVVTSLPNKSKGKMQ